MALAAAIAISSVAAHAAFPDQNIVIVVPYPPGSSADLLAREIGQRMSVDLGRQVIVDNRPGAAGSSGADYVAHARPDGYTLLLSTNSPLTTNLALYKSLHYDTLRDFTPVVLLGSNGLLVVAAPSQHLTVFGDLVARAKAKPGAINVGTSGNGGTAHLALAQLDSSAGIEMTHVPYTGGVQSLTAAMSGEVEVTIADIVPALPLIRDGHLIALASTAAHRPQVAKEIPTIAESGYPDVVVEAWLGLLAPKGTPQDIIETLNVKANRIIKSPDVSTQLIRLGVDPIGGTQAEFQKVLERDVPLWRARVKSAGLAID